MQRLLEWLQARSGRERRVLAGGAALALVLLVLVIVLPLGRAVTGATARIEAKHADLAWMRGVAAELAAAGPASPAHAAGQESLVVLVDRTAREAGLGESLTSSQPSGAGGLRVRLERASFDSMLAWFARLADQHGVRVEAADVEAAGEPGRVTANVVLRGS